MDEFYVIKVVDKSNKSGYVIDSVNGVLIATGMLADVTQFLKYTDAQKFITDHNLETGGVGAYIKSNSDIIKERPEGVFKADGDMFYIENIFGEKCCYNPKQDNYFFNKCDAVYCCWKSVTEAQGFIDAMEFDLPVFVITIKKKN